MDKDSSKKKINYLKVAWVNWHNGNVRCPVKSKMI